MTSKSDVTLKVGKKGEIFTNADLRKRAKIKEGGRVTANVIGDKLVIEPIPSIEELLRQRPILRTTTKEIEKMSEEIQKEEGAYG